MKVALKILRVGRALSAQTGHLERLMSRLRAQRRVIGPRRRWQARTRPHDGLREHSRNAVADSTMPPERALFKDI